MARRPPVPGALGPAGEQLWKDIAWKYPLRPDELKILRDVCMAADVQTILDSDNATWSIKTSGAQGQAVINPWFTAWRQYMNVVKGNLRLTRTWHHDLLIRSAAHCGQWDR